MLDEADDPAEIISGVATRAADAVIARIESRIISGELADGDFLPAERELMADYAVSAPWHARLSLAWPAAA